VTSNPGILPKILLSALRGEVSKTIRKELPDTVAQFFASAGLPDTLQQITKNDIDCVIFGTEIPKVERDAWVDRMRLASRRPLKIFLVTLDPAESVEDALACGAEALLKLPEDMSVLVEAVRNAAIGKEELWKRKNERFDVNLKLNVELGEINEVREGEVVNIGNGGMFLSIRFPLPTVGERISFKIYFHEKETMLIEGIGIVRWVRTRSEGRLAPGCGVEFVNLTENSISSLNRLLEVSRTKGFIPRL
jgi:hypothetical protein